MSEELTGRARGRARGRSRMEAAPLSEAPRRPGMAPVRQPQQTQPVVRPRPQEQLAGRARGTNPDAGMTHVSRQMGGLTLQAQGEPGTSSGAPSRGGVRNRRFDEVLTRPSSCVKKQGAKGEPVKLRSNYFTVQTQTEWALCQYRVDFSPDDERTSVRKGLVRIHKDVLGGAYVFDGTVLYTIKRLNPDPLELYSERLSDEAKIRITIKKTADLVKGDPHYLQFFNIVLRKCIAGLNLQLVGRDYYDAAGKVCIDKYNLELWPGFVTSIRQHENNILLGIDLANKIMRRDTALNLLQEISNRDDNWKTAFTNVIVGTTVITPYNNKTYRVDDVDFDSTPLSTFEKGKQSISYMDYYSQRYGVRITNTQQPMLISRPKLRDIRGGRDGNVILVPELCCLTGITDEMRNNFHLMRELEEHTRLHPSARMDKVVSFMRRLTSNKLASEELSLWNLRFSPDLIEFAGRVLVPERILHGNDQYSDGNREADWNRTLRGHSLYRSEEFHTWGIIYPMKFQRDVESFVRTLINAANSVHFRIPQPAFEAIPNDRAGTYVQAIEKLIGRMNPQLVMCIVPNNKADRYDAIKKKCSVDRAVPSQVVLSKNLAGKSVMSIATKIAIQLNCKIGGSPWSVIIPFKKPVMVVGFDVCHDTLSRERSYGAMVASLDGGYSRYFSACTPHTSGEELSNEISVHLVKAVALYNKYNQMLPPKIIIYRDGVGEGNEHFVLQHEVELIRSELQKLYGAEPLQMAFILVSKRINTRLFHNGANPAPGTIADDVVTNPMKYDFFLVSQSVRQGTVSPTSYNVIHDTTKLTADIMQQLAYKMCHLYFNWTGTVRVPAPVQYAHKLAFLCGQHLHRQPNEALNELLYFL